MRGWGLPYVLMGLQAILWVVILGVRKEISRKRFSAKDVNKSLVWAGAISVAAAMVSAVTTTFAGPSERELYKVMSAPFILTTLVTVAIALMYFVWAFNDFDFWRLTKGQPTNQHARNFHLGVSLVTFIAAAAWMFCCWLIWI